MTRFDDNEMGPMPTTGPTWTSKRTKPKGKEAEEGERGIMRQCLGGDEIWIYNRAGTRRYEATVAWCWPDGGAMVRLGGEPRELRDMPATAAVEWRKVRPK